MFVRLRILMALAVLVGLSCFIYKVAPALWVALRDRAMTGKSWRRVAFRESPGRYLFHVALLAYVLLMAAVLIVASILQLASVGRMF